MPSGSAHAVSRLGSCLVEHFREKYRCTSEDIINAVTLDGQVRAVPIDVPRESAFFYNMTLFNANGLTAPTTIAELMTTCATLKAAGVTPIALGTGSSNGWIVR